VQGAVNSSPERPLTILQGKNTGIKAVFGGAQKKPLMTKVSMRHLNEIVRERNQYSRDAQEAWQDFINLKGRMDGELTKVTKRNNFLVDELESWKQQFLKFQAFAEQLTKETNELKVKIENHKRENRRLGSQIDQEKETVARLTVRLAGTEKQRDDSLEALVLQQEIAEELERERKRNKKDLSALQHTNTTLLRQRDEAQRVVLHLRALIDGQAHHMQHIVKSIGDSPDGLAAELGLDQAQDEQGEGGLLSSRTSSRSSTRQSSTRGDEDISRDMESRQSISRKSKRFSTISMNDISDRNLRDKTDSIAYIIRNISEQCAAAVEGLDLARRADSVSTDNDDNRSDNSKRYGKRRLHRASSAEHEPAEGASTHSGSEYGDAQSEATSYLHPHRLSSVPPTPDLEHNRSSTSMSLGSESTAATPQRQSINSQYKTIHEDIPEVPTRIVDHEGASELGAEMVDEPVSKYGSSGYTRGRQPATS
jgi:hypothetical protein